jgi:hypothetical protein
MWHVNCIIAEIENKKLFPHKRCAHKESEMGAEEEEEIREI